MKPTIETRVERSSLGTQQARAARRTVSAADAARIVARSKDERQKRESHSKTGG